jgi:hypothetical protein
LRAKPGRAEDASQRAVSTHAADVGAGAGLQALDRLGADPPAQSRYFWIAGFSGQL